MIAAHLDRAYADLHESEAALHGDDPSPGWAFLRKLIQLPVIVPHIPDDGINRFIDLISPTAGRLAAVAPTPTDTRASARVQPTTPAGRPDNRPTTASPHDRRLTARPAASDWVSLPVDTLAWRTMEQHPAVRDMLIQRLVAQPDRSIREAKRLINVWQLYERVLNATEPLAKPAEAITRARHLVLVAEIVTRWPALQRPLHRLVDGQRGLQLLASRADDDQAWKDVVESLGIDQIRHERALANLRRLLQQHDGSVIADLASLVL